MYLTTRQEAKHPDCPFTEHHLRLRVSQGRIPGVRVGNRFLIDHEAFVALIKREAMQNVTGAKIKEDDRK